VKIGLIQTRGIGDIVIAAPIAQHFVAQGHQVFWPVDNRFYPFFQSAFPEINFLSVDSAVTGEVTLDYWYNNPLAQLTQVNCDQFFCLYSYLSGLDVTDQKLAHSLKFDEYKYAVTGVPFAQKWRLKVTRNRARERALFDKLDIRGDYVLVHELGSDFSLRIELPADVVATHQVVRISEISDNPFDWLGVIEQANMFVCVDSCFANFAEQLSLCPRKYLFLRSDIRYTPVFKDNWQFR
jgi:hypothetical protein